MADSMVTIKADRIKHETDKAWLAIIGGKEIWFPKSQCTKIDDTSLSVPDWLKKAKEL